MPPNPVCTAQRMGGDSGSDEDDGGAAQTLTHGAELWQTRRDAAVAAASAAEPTEGTHEGPVPAGGGEGAASRPATDRDSASEEARRVAVQAARPPVEGFDMFADQVAQALKQVLEHHGRDLLNADAEMRASTCLLTRLLSLYNPTKGNLSTLKAEFA